MKSKNWLYKFGVVIASAKAVFAYLDPGSGSLLIQLLIAVIVGVLATFRLWKSRVLRLFGMEEEKDQPEDNVDNTDQV